MVLEIRDFINPIKSIYDISPVMNYIFLHPNTIIALSFFTGGEFTLTAMFSLIRTLLQPYCCVNTISFNWNKFDTSTIHQFCLFLKTPGNSIKHLSFESVRSDNLVYFYTSLLDVLQDVNNHIEELELKFMEHSLQTLYFLYLGLSHVNNKITTLRLYFSYPITFDMLKLFLKSFSYSTNKVRQLDIRNSKGLLFDDTVLTFKYLLSIKRNKLKHMKTDFDYVIKKKLRI